MSKVVMAAHWSRPKVAKKVFLKALKVTENRRPMIDEEVSALNALQRFNNTNIARLNEVQLLEEDIILLEFQLVQGKTLSSILKERKSQRQPFTEDEAYKLSGDVCSALTSVSSIDRVHHDVKPSNIMFNGTDYVLLDFGENGDSPLFPKAPPEEVTCVTSVRIRTPERCFLSSLERKRVRRVPWSLGA